MSAEHHWTALDHTFSRLLPATHIAQGRQRLARRAAALTDIYLRRFVNAARHASGDRSVRLEADRPDRSVRLQADQPGATLTRQLLELQRVHRALTAALAATWNGTDSP